MLKQSILSLSLLLATSHSALSAGREMDLTKLKSFVLDDQPYTNVYAIDSIPALKGRSVKQRPWSSSFLPALLGYAAAPYINQTDFELFLAKISEFGFRQFEETRMRQLEHYRHSITEGELDTLAPSEKYDMITGTIGTKQSLTYRLWLQAKQQDDRNGTAFWTGMCNGWSPASIIYKRPEHRIFVPSADGKYRVPFYPEDIKQLGSTLFFNTTTVESDMTQDNWKFMGKMPMMGLRCNKTDLRKDAGGFILDPECEDVMPHDWHFTVVNLIGKQDQPFVADVHANGPVGNFPIWAYRFSYYNPMTEKAGDLHSSLVPLSQYRAQGRKDPMRIHRSPRAVSVVGIKMRVWGAGAHSSDRALDDSVSNDATKTFNFTYDLEMDAAGDIVGGQWRDGDEDNHPDFVWYPPRSGIQNSATAVLPSAGEYSPSKVGYTGQYDAAATGNWDPATPMPASWREQAGKAALVLVNVADMRNNSYDQIRPQPLGKIVYALFDQASGTQAGNPAPVTPGTPPKPPAPAIHVKASLQTGLFAYDERCNYEIASTLDAPIVYEMPYMRDGGGPIGAKATFQFWSATRTDGRVDAWVRSRVFNAKGQVDKSTSKIQHVVLKRGESESVGVDFWYNDGFAPMLNHYRVELKWGGKTVPSPASATQLACGQIFL